MDIKSFIQVRRVLLVLFRPHVASLAIVPFVNLKKDKPSFWVV